jgi:hypothetical protein
VDADVPSRAGELVGLVTRRAAVRQAELGPGMTRPDPGDCVVGPSGSSIRSPFGASETPAPTSVSSAACSYTRTPIPALVSASAAATPPIPPPTTTALSVILVSLLRR